MAKADFISALIFFVLGIYMIAEGWSLPGAGGFIEPGGEPGRVPILLGAIVAFFALVLLVRAVSQQGHKLFDNRQTDAEERTGRFRTAITAVGCSLYAVGLVGANIAGWNVQYHEATFVFLFVFIVGFEWEFAPELGAKRWAWVRDKFPGVATIMNSTFGFISTSRAPYVWLIFVALLQAVLVTWGVTYVFEQEFYVKLP